MIMCHCEGAQRLWQSRRDQIAAVAALPRNDKRRKPMFSGLVTDFLTFDFLLLTWRKTTARPHAFAETRFATRNRLVRVNVVHQITKLAF